MKEFNRVMTERDARPARAVMLLWLANILLIGGAVMISVLPASASSPLIFAGFLLGHAVLVLHSLRLRDRGLLVLNAALGALDLYALVIRL